MQTREEGRPHRQSGAFTGAPVTLVIVMANLAIFAGEVIASRSLRSLVEVPAQVWLAFGANYAPLTLALGQYDRLVASCFVHGSLLHVALNMWSLRNIGPFVERTVGSARYPVLYVVTGIVGSASSVAWGLISGHVVPSVGASGAICGVIGAALVLGVRLEGWRSGIARQIGFWIVDHRRLRRDRPGDRQRRARRRDGVGVPHRDRVAPRGPVLTARHGRVHRRLRRRVYRGGGAVVWRDATDPYALRGPNERSDLVVLALKHHDCAGARKALVATEAVSAPTPELDGLRAEVDRACPPGTP